MALALFAASVEPHALQSPQRTPRVHALLIGVTSYPSLNRSRQLEGPLNDVALIRRVLRDRFQFTNTSIVELSAARIAAGPPTRANIQREFTRLAGSTVNAGDRVVIFFAGHGSQQPDDNGDEADGLDEIILPTDAGPWDGTVGRVRNAIVDDEIRQWLTAIRNRGAFVFVAFDACQSSTLTRGEVETYRQVPVTELVPEDVMATVSARTRGAEGPESAILELESGAGGIAALYAAQTTELTPEKRLPTSNGPVHGLFTYTLVEALEQSDSPITYRELAGRIIEKYRAMGRSGPTPGFEGGGLDESFLSTTVWAGRARLSLGAQVDGRPIVQAGAIHGLTRGTILRVFPPPGSKSPNESVGHVRVTELDPTRAVVEPFSFGRMPAPALSRLVPNSLAEVAMFDYGDDALKVALHPDPKYRGTAAAVINDALSRLKTLTNGQAERATSIQSADWVLSANGDDVTLAPASGWRIDSTRSLETAERESAFRVGKATANFADRLAQTLRQVARVRGLMKLATTQAAAGSDVNVAVNLIRYKDERDTVGAPVPLEKGGRVLHPGDQIAFRVANTGKTAADVTLVLIDSQYGIEAIFPKRDAEADSRLVRGAIVTPRFDVTSKTVGWEQVIAIAVQSGAGRVDFNYLEQPTLELATRGASSRTGSKPERRSPLQQLLDRSVFGAGTTRGLTDTELGMYAMKMLAWRTEP